MNTTIAYNTWQIKDDIKFRVIQKHVSEIQSGDVILIDNKLKTVSKKDIKHDKFIGTTIFGDSYNDGNKLVNFCEIFYKR